MLDKIPMFSIGNDELDSNNKIKKGDLIQCKKCGGTHKVALGIGSHLDSVTNEIVVEEESNTIQFYSCGDKCFMCGLDNITLPGITVIKE